MTKTFNIAIDGPAGSGKSSVSKEFAKRHPEFLYINTGAMFRTYALFLIQNNIDPTDLEAIKKALKVVNVELEADKVYMVTENSKVDVTDTVKAMEVAKVASIIASLPIVREKLLIDQRNIAAKNNVIMDGRDIGTVILPNAQLKIYLEASSKERATRRLKELKELHPDQEFDLLQIQKEIDERDYKDMNREIAPLKKADDAVILDTDGLTVATCCDAIEDIYNKRVAELSK